MEHLAQIVLLLAVALGIVAVFQRLRIPSSLGYLVVGVLLGPHTIGPTVYVPEFEALAEFGVVFLLFTIGLDYSPPQLRALRHQVMIPGTAQVALVTVLVALLLWFVGVPAAAACVVGAVFAQSSTTILGSQLREQGEETSRHGRLGLAISVFQDLTAVPLLVIVPVLGLPIGAWDLAGVLGLVAAKAAAAIALVVLLGRQLLRPFFRAVAKGRSAELFTLALLAAWGTHGAGLSLAFGAFLAGMMLGETEFRHQVESSIRPFRDVLLGLFFVGIGMRFDPAAVQPIWPWAILGALLILASKTLVVAGLLRLSGEDRVTAWRGGLLLGVGGEFGLALLVIAMDAGVVAGPLVPIVISSVLLSMIGGSVLIRFNRAIGGWIARARGGPETGAPKLQGIGTLPGMGQPRVLIGGYGRVGHTIAVLLEANEVPFLALDTDPQRVAQGLAGGHSVYYGDISDHELLAAVPGERADLAVITVDQSAVAEKAVRAIKDVYPGVSVIARARDLAASARLLEAGATHAYPEAIEASLALGATTLEMLAVPAEAVDQTLQGVRDGSYRPVMEPEESAAGNRLANRSPGPGPRPPSGGTDPAGNEPNDRRPQATRGGRP